MKNLLKNNRIFISFYRIGIFLILLSPLLLSADFFFPFLGAKMFYFMFFSGAVFFFWLFLAFLYPSFRPRFNIVIIALLIYFFFLILASIFGINPLKSFWSDFERMSGVIELLYFLRFFFVLISCLKKQEEWLGVLMLSVIIAVIISLFFIMGLIYPVTGIEETCGGSLIGNSSFLATFLLFNLFFAIYPFFESINSDKIQKILVLGKDKALFIFGLCIITISTALFFSTGWAALLSSIFGVFLIYILYLSLKIQDKNLNRLGRLILASIIIVGLLLIIALHIYNSPIQKIVARYAGGRWSRFIVWEASKVIIETFPFLGIGPENFETSFNINFNPKMYTPEVWGGVRFDKAHNINYDTMVSVGILGFLAYLSVIIGAIYFLWKRYKEKKIDFWEASIFSTILITHYIQNLVVFDTPTGFLMLFLTLGFISRTIEGETKERLNKNKIVILCMAAFLLLCFCFSTIKFIYQPLKTNLLTIAALREQDPQKRVELEKGALLSSPMGSFQIKEFFADQAMKNFKKEKSKEELTFLISQLRESIKRNPYDFYSYIYLGHLEEFYYQKYQDKSKLLEAEKAFQRAIQIAPTNQQGYWYLADVKLLEKKKGSYGVSREGTKTRATSP